MKAFTLFTTGVEKIAEKMSSASYITIIRDSFIYAITLVIIGAFANLINNVLCNTTNGLAYFSQFAFLAKFSSIFTSINYATMNFLAIFIVFLIASHLSRIRNIDNILAGLVALISYVVLIPTEISTKTVSGDIVNVNNVVSSTYTGSQGLFLAMIVGIAATELFAKLQSIDQLKIKMPGSVPVGVSKQFNLLFPGIITVLAFGVVGYLFQLITGKSITDVIYTVLQQPMERVMQYPLGFTVLILLSQAFWVIGIHGSSMIKAVREPIALAAIAANLAAYQSGRAMENIFTIPFWNIFSTIGGAGNTIALIIAIFIFSKREDHRAIAKLSVVPAFFGINEPVIFGLPIVLNPLLAIPFILAPVLSALLGYYLTYIGFAGITMIQIPFTVPPLLNAFIASSGSIGLVITQVLAIILSTLIYIPFVRVANDLAEKDQSL
ncbi:MAG: PTS transporter subunit EIIC [Sporolactobacillus sp.]|jgi:PTS system cellobiose-specific IIC component|nr:PTS transporter subunit EIIC [Sporolactobacillus sp.]